MLIRPATPADAAFVLAHNAADVEVLAPMDRARFLEFLQWADPFLIAEVDGAPAGFLIALPPGVDAYPSENYAWFSARYQRFLYVDRVVVAADYRGRGVGRQLYREVFRRAAEQGADVVLAEIDTAPIYNETSLRFHAGLGFAEVGTQVTRGGEVTVSLQAKTL